MFKLLVSKFTCLAVLFNSFLFSNQNQGEFMECGTNCAVASENIKPINEYGHIDTNGLATLISSGVPFVILDARGGKWDDGKRIASAETLSYDATVSEAANVIPTKQSLIVVYCSNPQCPASSYLAKHLTELGYTNILKYDAGIQEWIGSGRLVRETR